MEGLLFYLSGEHGTEPDVACGDAKPNFCKDVEIIEDGVNGKAIRCLPSQLFTYWAPGNIYAQRGTLAFFWRSRTPLGVTEFPLFRVAFADHSSWDAVFLRIDYNGKGIDAFVTDINLSRIRVSSSFSQIPAADQWFHVAFSWDETEGVRLYLDGKLAAEKKKKAILYAGLDQFGTHSRIISNAQVQSSYNYVRTGDFDEIAIFDRMLTDDEIQMLAKGRIPQLTGKPARTLKEEKWNQEWQQRYGFDAEKEMPPLSWKDTAVHKVEIHDAWDHKRWWWKGCDGIRETTWPGVYNRSGLPGRCDYFVLPDWDCYSVSGKEITFQPDRDKYFNQIEMSGSAQGNLRIHGRMEEQLTIRREASERSALRLAEPVRNVDITFTNDVIEEPIGDITLLYVEPGMPPKGEKRESFYFGTEEKQVICEEDCSSEKPGILEIKKFVQGRFLEDERTILYGSEKAGTLPDMTEKLPIVHLAVPYNQAEGYGLDGVLVHLPALSGEASGQKRINVNIQVKDPLWIYRNLLQFTFSVLPGREKSIWLDTRDRILPEGKAMYITISWSEAISGADLTDLRVELIYKTAEEAKAEHIEDRWIQVKDNYANLVEENPSNEHFNMFVRFKSDLEDLLKVCPEHRLAREYWYDKFKTNPPEFEYSRCPDGIPLWAWRQTEYMGYVKRYIRWWIDKRQIENGEFGGGLSDDGDLTAWWPGPALAGCMPEKIRESLTREMEAFYDQGMFSNGLCAIQTDQLHTLEEGIQCLGQCLTLIPDSPKYLERAMENARGLHYVTGYNQKGHRHLLSGYYSGTRIAREAPWNYSASDSFHVFHPTYMLIRYNGSPIARKLVLEMADSMMEHYYNGKLHVQIQVDTDEDQTHERTREWPLFYAAWQFTGDRKYLAPIAAELYETQKERCKAAGEALEETTARRYEDILRKAALREYINTDGQLWVDRGVIDIGILQQDRIGGIGHERFALYPRHYFRWEFCPSQETDVGILVTDASFEKIELTAYNMTDQVITARMVMENIVPGIWKVCQGTGQRFGEILEQEPEKERPLEWMQAVTVNFQPYCYTMITLELVEKTVDYHERPDLAIDQEDVLVRDDCIRIKVHNIGGAESQETTVVLKNAEGQVLRSSIVPPLPAPNDLYPKTVEIPLWTRGIDLDGCYVELDPEQRLKEITRTNNIRPVIVR